MKCKCGGELIRIAYDAYKCNVCSKKQAIAFEKKEITKQDVINSLRVLPEQQKVNIALEANLREINIEKNVVPAITNVANAYIKAVETLENNLNVILGENYRFLNK